MHILLRRVVIISIHAPREGSDLAQAMNAFGGLLQFLSTLPVRGATCQYVARYIVKKQFLSTLPVRGATARRMLV